VKFKIYKITSPSGRSYFGFTAQSLKERWRQHQGSASRGRKTPFYAAIRKYGAETFRIEIIAEFDNVIDAAAEEIRVIANAVKPYNVSRGGEHDVTAAHDSFRELLKDPVWKAAYGKKLSEACKNSERHRATVPYITGKLKEWQKANPRRVIELQRRITRIAAKKNKGKKPWNYGVKASPVAKYKMSIAQLERQKYITPSQRKRMEIIRRRNTQKAWDNRSEHQIEEIAEKISASMSTHHASMSNEEKKIHLTQLALARKNIDHTVRKRRQKEALQRYWTPERRAQKSLEVREGKNYANVRHNQFRTQQ
jgi:hypothetical protein